MRGEENGWGEEEDEVFLFWAGLGWDGMSWDLGWAWDLACVGVGLGRA